MVLVLWVVGCGAPAPTTEHTADGLEVLVLGAEGPLVVGLHGHGGRPDALLDTLRGVLRPARIVVPIGPDVERSGRSWFPIPEGVYEPADLVAATDRVAALIRERRGDGPVVLTGVSQGGMITLALVIRHPDLVDLALPIAATLPGSLLGPPPEDAPPIRAFHGADDELFPVAGTRAKIDQLRALGWDATLVEVPGVTHGPARALLELRDAAIADPGWQVPDVTGVTPVPGPGSTKAR